MTQIKYTRSTLVYLDNLIKVLLKKGYFAIEGSAIEYGKDIKAFVASSIEKQQHTRAPAEFNKFGKNLKFISYKRNKRTTWYIFFIEKNNHFLVKHITNNHLSAQYFKE